MMFNNIRYSLVLIILLLLVGILFIISISTGSVPVSGEEILLILKGKEYSSLSVIILEYRLPKALAAILCGIGLSISGLQMQTLFRNPLAGPYVLGISSGAGLGVALLLMPVTSMGSFYLAHGFSMAIAAFLGSFSVLLLLYLANRKIQDIMTLLVLGILFGSITSSFISLLQFLSPSTELKNYVIWSMGNLSSITPDQIFVLSLIISLGLLINLFIMKTFNLYYLGESYAHHSGVNVKQFRMIVFVSTAILAGGVTAFAGPIGFVGVVVPHLARLILNSANYYKVFFVSILAGAVLMLLCDIFSSMPLHGQILPLNVITSFIGIPVIIWLLFSHKGISGFF